MIGVLGLQPQFLSMLMWCRWLKILRKIVQNSLFTVSLMCVFRVVDRSQSTNLLLALRVVESIFLAGNDWCHYSWWDMKEGNTTYLSSLLLDCAFFIPICFRLPFTLKTTTVLLLRFFLLRSIWNSTITPNWLRASMFPKRRDPTWLCCDFPHTATRKSLRRRESCVYKDVFTVYRKTLLLICPIIHAVERLVVWRACGPETYFSCR